MEDFNKYKDMVTASLFERYFENANDSIKETLNYQYRMHTDIMDIINIFYDEYLRDGNEDSYTYDIKAHYLSIPSTSGTEMIIPDMLIGLILQNQQEKRFMNKDARVVLQQRILQKQR